MAWVVDPTNECIITVADFTGKLATTQYWVASGDTDPGAGGPAALAAAVGGITTGAVTNVEVLIHATQSSAVSPGTGAFDRVQDKMKLTLRSASGALPILQIPTLNETILGPDGVKIDPADSLVVALVAALVSYGKTAEGTAIVGLQAGYRRRPSGLKHQ